MVDPGEETTRVWRESVVWYLRRGLKGAGDVQEGMMVKRVEREMEKRRSVLSMSPNWDGIGGTSIGEANGVGGKGWEGQKVNGVMGAVEMEEEGKGMLEGLSEQQMQMLEDDNADLMRRYGDELGQVRYVQAHGSFIVELSGSGVFQYSSITTSSVLTIGCRTAHQALTEISEINTQIIMNLAVQSESIQHMDMESLQTTENIGGGNKQLKKATERKSTARMVFWATCGLCGFLVTWDLVF